MTWKFFPSLGKTAREGSVFAEELWRHGIFGNVAAVPTSGFQLKR